MTSLETRSSQMQLVKNLEIILNRGWALKPVTGVLRRHIEGHMNMEAISGDTQAQGLSAALEAGRGWGRFALGALGRGQARPWLGTRLVASRTGRTSVPVALSPSFMVLCLQQPQTTKVAPEAIISPAVQFTSWGYQPRSPFRRGGDPGPLRSGGCCEHYRRGPT